MNEMTEILRRRRDVKTGQKDNFFVGSQDSLLDIYNQLTGATYLVLTGLIGLGVVTLHV